MAVKQIHYNSSTTLHDQTVTGAVTVRESVVTLDTTGWREVQPGDEANTVFGVVSDGPDAKGKYVVTTDGHARVDNVVAGTTYYVDFNTARLTTVAGEVVAGIAKLPDAREGAGVVLEFNSIPSGIESDAVQSYATPYVFENGSPVDHVTPSIITKTFDKRTKGIIIMTGTFSLRNNSFPTEHEFSIVERLTIDSINYATNQTNFKVESSFYGLSTEKLTVMQYAFDLPAGTHTFGYGYRLLQGALNGLENRTGDIAYSILYI